MDWCGQLIYFEEITLRATFNAFCGDEEQELDNNPCIHRKKELGMRQGEKRVISLCGWKYEPTIIVWHDKDGQFTPLKLVTGTGSKADNRNFLTAVMLTLVNSQSDSQLLIFFVIIK